MWHCLQTATMHSLLQVLSSVLLLMLTGKSLTGSIYWLVYASIIYWGDITSKLGMFLGCKLYKLGGKEDNIWGWLVVYILHFFHHECVVQMGNPVLPTVAKIVKRMSLKKNINCYVWTATGLKRCCYSCCQAFCKLYCHLLWKCLAVDMK